LEESSGSEATEGDEKPLARVAARGEENHLPQVVEGEEKVLNLGWWAVEEEEASSAVGG